jgi:hypothetical protein
MLTTAAAAAACQYCLLEYDLIVYRVWKWTAMIRRSNRKFLTAPRLQVSGDMKPMIM